MAGDRLSSHLLAALVARHCEAEAAQDLEGVLATVSANRWFEIHPLGLVLTSPSAVRAFYTRMIGLFGQLKPAGPSATYDGTAGARYRSTTGIVTRDHVVMETASGKRRSVKSLAVFELDEASGLVRGEEIFLNGAAAEVFSAALGPDFRSLPGVSSADADFILSDA